MLISHTLVCGCMHVCVLTWLSFPSCRMGSRSPPNASQPPAFFSKLTESTSAIVKSKKQEMIKKMTVSNETDFSKSDLRIEMSVEGNCRCDFIERLLGLLKRNAVPSFRFWSAWNRNLQYASVYSCR